MEILIARDEAFNFTYRANIDALRELGETHFFSPLRDSSLPDCDLLYLPGGYPELFADQLSANTPMRESIRKYAETGGRIYAECGGFMYLTRNIDGTPMCGVLPLEATMQGARLHLGYRTMEWSGIRLRGHEFHYSAVRQLEDVQSDLQIIAAQCTARGITVDTPIYCLNNVVAGYTHWYWADNLTAFCQLNKIKTQYKKQNSPS